MARWGRHTKNEGLQGPLCLLTSDKLSEDAFRGIFSFNRWVSKVPVFVVVVIDRYGLMFNAMDIVRTLSMRMELMGPSHRRERVRK
jgi:hypothetical protein